MLFNILIADDHEVIINGLQAMLDGPKLPFVLEQANSIASLKAKLNETTHVLILDINFGEINSINYINGFRKLYPNLKIIIFTSYNTPAFRREAAYAGANAFLTKDSDKGTLLDTIYGLLDNETFQEKATFSSVQVPPTAVFLAENNLSNRQLEVLKLVAYGNTSQQIAETLHLSKHTVQWHRKNVLKRLELKSVSEMIKYAYEKGLV